jgi:hypothetical protein
MSILTSTLTQAQQACVITALRLLERHAPDHLRHLLVHISSIEHAPTGCSLDRRTIACTGGPFYRTIVLQHDPIGCNTIDLAVTLSHEARHWDIDAMGYQFLVPHQCSEGGCYDAAERALDPIYACDELLRAHLFACLYPQPARRSPSALELALGVAAAGTAVYAGYKLAEFLTDSEPRRARS